MRKKELLRQYWENMDDGNAQKDDPNAATSTTNNGRNGTPKADNGMGGQQLSMAPIDPNDPMRSDLQSNQMSTSYHTPPLDAPMYNHKKRKMPANRELRQLEVISYDEEAPERRATTGSNGSQSSDEDGESSKRVTRTKLPPMTTPKLKIKIGPDIIEPSGSGDSGRARPPKKRLSNITMPSLEEIRRDSMNFRKQVISEFNEAQPKPKKNKDKDKDKDKEKDKDKPKREKGKHKKKKDKEKDKDKDKDRHEVTFVNDKLVIRVAKRKADSEKEASSDEAEASTSGTSKAKANDTNPPSPSGLLRPLFLPRHLQHLCQPTWTNPFLLFLRLIVGDFDASAAGAPIRLKIARNSHGKCEQPTFAITHE